MKWLLPKALEKADEEKIQALAQELAFDPDLIRLLYRRGFQEKGQLEDFLHPSFEQYHDPFLLHDMDRAVHRVHQALENDEAILIYGDYDADGMTATSILLEGLEAIGANVHYYLPNRFTDGYGPNKAVYRYYIEQGIQLILTVDNGVSGHEAIAFAQEQGVDVVVTDHHDLPDQLPNAYAIVHPRHKAGDYPFGDLCGAGVALKFVHAITGEFPSELVDLAAVGTIADLVSLVDENRFIVQMGLQLMNQGHRLGLQAILSNLTRAHEGPITEQTVGFTLAPRLNALGRLKDPNPAVELLTTFDEDRANELAKELEAVNQERMDLVSEASQRAMTLVGPSPKEKIIVVYQPDFHQGILGIVASRLLDHYQRPIIVLGDDANGEAIKGSARSIPSIHLYELLQEVADTLLVFGGHAQAAGMTVEKDNFERFKAEIEATMATREVGEPSQQVDMVLTSDQATQEFYEKMRQLAPFGSHFPQPMIGIMDANLKDMRAIGSQKDHLKGSIDQLAFIAFRAGDRLSELSEADGVNAYGQLSLNYWQGKVTVQLQVQGFESYGKRWLDQRKSRINPSWLTLPNSLYVIETPRIKQWLAPQLAGDSKVVSYDELGDITQAFDRIILLECPLKSLTNRRLSVEMADEIWLVAYRFYHYLERGLPAKADFGRIYRLLPIDQGISLEQLMAKTQKSLSREAVTFIIKVFSELKFVILEADQIKRVAHPQAADLSQSRLVRQRQEAAELERLFAYQPLATIKKIILSKNEDE